MTLDELPSRTPDLARGAEVYRANCAGCHGDLGRGDGPLAAGLDPPPANLADWGALRDQSPLDYYRRISIGVVGTAMPAFEDRLPAEDRWAVGALRLAPSACRPRRARRRRRSAPSPPPARCPTPSCSTRSARRATAPRRRARAPGRDPGLSERRASPAGEVLGQVRAQVDSAYALARTGDPAPATRALDAYMTFEQVERELRGQGPRPGRRAGDRLRRAPRRAAAGGAGRRARRAARARLDAGLESGRARAGRRGSRRSTCSSSRS